MHRTTLVTLNMRELDRLKVIQAVVDTGLKPGRAAERLGVTVRQVQRLVERYRESGAAGLVSRKRDRPGNRRLDEELARRALAIIRDRYADIGPTLACEKLLECHGIRLAKETLRKLMTDAGLWVPRRQRPPKVYQPRARRAWLGELIQIDGSEHAWFETGLRNARCWCNRARDARRTPCCDASRPESDRSPWEEIAGIAPVSSSPAAIAPGPSAARGERAARQRA